jgi:NAD(P)-dependent dehydrogenase (short-subunit alcohol dehydrogenase family)
VAALFARVAAEQPTLDLLANAVWGAHDAAATTEEVLSAWGKPFWELPASGWRHQVDAGARAYFLASREALRLMAPRKRGLIVGVTDGLIDDVSEEVLSGHAFGDYSGALLWDLGHVVINRLMHAMAADAKPHKVAVVTLMPGFMQTERVARAMTSDATKKQFRYDLSETTEYVGRAVVALARDRHAIERSGRIHFVADLADEYGFTDASGVRVPRFKPY